MNKQRRLLIKEAEQILDKAKDIIDDVFFEEKMSFDNLSKGLQCTMRGQVIDGNIDILSEIKEKLEETIDLINDIN